jgi:tetratricopeptide (TPR) repeat protein
VKKGTGKLLFVVAACTGLAGSVCMGMSGCSSSKAKDQTASKTSQKSDDPQIPSLLSAMSSGRYDEVIRLSKEVLGKNPSKSTVPAVLYLQGYAIAYGRSDFPGAVAPAKKLLELDPNGPYAAEAQKLLADCQYWLGHYGPSVSEYKKLEQVYGNKGYGVYAQTQIGNCQFLEGKVGDALATYRLVVEKSPRDPLAVSAQLMIGNIYLKVQNLGQARAEFQKIIAMTDNNNLQQAVQNTLKRLEKSESGRRGAVSPASSGL